MARRLFQREPPEQDLLLSRLRSQKDWRQRNCGTLQVRSQLLPFPLQEVREEVRNLQLSSQAQIKDSPVRETLEKGLRQMRQSLLGLKSPQAAY